MVKNLSCVVLCSLKRFPHKFTTDTPYRQDPNLGEDKDGLLGPKKGKYKVCSLLNKAPPNFGSSAAFSCQFSQALRYQNRNKGFVWHGVCCPNFQWRFWHEIGDLHDWMLPQRSSPKCWLIFQRLPHGQQCPNPMEFEFQSSYSSQQLLSWC